VTAKVEAKIVRTLLRDAVGPPLASLGFERAKTTLPCWRREHAGAWLAVTFPFHKYGWHERFGSSFELKFHVGADADSFSRPLAFAWFNQLLDADELEALQARNNRVAASIDAPYYEDPGRPQETIDWDRMALLVRTTPYRPHESVSLYYRSRDDAEAWAAYFGGTISSLLARFIERLAVEAG